MPDCGSPEKTGSFTMSGKKSKKIEKRLDQLATSIHMLMLDLAGSFEQYGYGDDSDNNDGPVIIPVTEGSGLPKPVQPWRTDPTFQTLERIHRAMNGSPRPTRVGMHGAVKVSGCTNGRDRLIALGTVDEVTSHNSNMVLLDIGTAEALVNDLTSVIAELRNQDGAVA